MKISVFLFIYYHKLESNDKSLCLIKTIMSEPGLLTKICVVISMRRAINIDVKEWINVKNGKNRFRFELKTAKKNKLKLIIKLVQPKTSKTNELFNVYFSAGY